MFLAYVEVSLLGKVLEFKLLNTLEFTSQHRRILVVVQEHGTGTLELLTKGVDETVFPTLCSCTYNNVVLALLFQLLSHPFLPLLLMFKTKV
jgi:magnesium-transporting ATPase (P-type)